MFTLPLPRRGVVHALSAEDRDVFPHQAQEKIMELICTLRGPVAWLTLNRPEALNALSRPVFQQLADRLPALQSDPAVRVVVLTGTGRAFCAGGDLKGLLHDIQEAGSEDYLSLASRVFAMLRDFPKPVVAAVNGLAMAGGLELILACDIVFAADESRIGDAHTNFGLIPGAGGAAILPRMVPLNVAKQMLFSGDSFPPGVWKAHGLVNEIVPNAELAAAVQAFAEKIAEKSPLALRRIKEIANRAGEKTREEALRHEMHELRAHLQSRDVREGLTAFSERRKPRFEGV